MHNSFLLSALALQLLGSPAFARWMDPSEASSATKLEHLHYKVNKDGSYSLERERRTAIYKDSARVDLGMKRFVFDARSTRFEVEEAYSQNGSKKTPVRPEHIEVKSLASSGPGFDDRKQLTIAFPKVDLGTELYYRTSQTVEKARMPGLFSFVHNLGWNEFLHDLVIEVDSEVPLYSQVFDPENRLDVVKEKRGDRYFVSFRLKAPFLRRIVQEENSSMDPHDLIWVGVSTAKDWESLPEFTPAAYEKILSTPLPDFFIPLVIAGKKQADPVAQINAVTSTLAAQMRYVGDWVTVEGAYHPRALSLIAETGFGDCKDFSAVTAAVLRQLGFEADVAWIDRAKRHVETPLSIAALDFNHAIVHATKAGREYWVDPTNNTSFAQYIYEDIADRLAIVIHPGKTVAKRTPAMLPSDGETKVSMDLDVRNEKKSEVQGSISLKGRAALYLTGWGLTYSKSQMDYFLMDWLFPQASIKSWNFSAYDLSSRIVQPFDTTFTFLQDLISVPTSAGRGFVMPVNPFLSSLQARREGRVGALELSFPLRWSREIHLSGKKFRVSKALSCQGKSEWFDFSSSLKKAGLKLVVSEKVTIKKSRISPAEFLSPAFAEIQDKYLRCMQAGIVIY